MQLCPCEIVNRGTKTEFFLGAAISAAARTHLIGISAEGGFETPVRVEIPPGAALDFSRHRWCLFMSGIAQSLEADMGAVAGQLLFENAGRIDVDFMIDTR